MIMNHTTFASRLLALLACTLLPAATYAGALYFYEMGSASESSYGGAGMVARANDAGTVFTNPAGMTRFDETEIMAGATGVFIDANFRTNSRNTVDGSTRGVNHRIVPGGSFAYVRPVSDRLSVGISAGNYFGLAIDWDDDWVGRYASVNIALLAPQLQPTVAYKVNDWLSVGGGAAVTLGYMSDKMRLKSITPGGADGKLRISDTDLAVQYNLGVMLEPWKHTRIGIRYLTETDLDFEDDPNTSWKDPLGNLVGNPDTDLDLGVTMPQELQVAVHHQWNERLNLLGNVGWTDISEFGRVQVNVDGAGMVDTTVDADFRDVWNFGIGAEYQWKPDLQLTAGFQMDTSMSTDRTRPIVIPIGSLYRYAIGFKYKKRQDLTLGGGLTFIWEGNLPVKDTAGTAGKYKNVSLTIASFYARWH